MRTSSVQSKKEYSGNLILAPPWPPPGPQAPSTGPIPPAGPTPHPYLCCSHWQFGNRNQVVELPDSPKEPLLLTQTQQDCLI